MKAMMRGVTKGLPQSGLQGGAGVGVFYLHRMLTSKVAFLQNHPLAAPIGFVVLGHVLKKSKKLGSVGAALVGAGGYAGAQVFEVRKSIQAQQTAPAQTSGFDDTGALVQASNIGEFDNDTGMLLNSSNIGSMPEETASSYESAYKL